MDSSRPTLGSAILSRLVMVVVITALFTALGAAAGFAMKPTFTASTRLIVGTIGAANSSVPGSVSANQNLAGTYARLVNTNGTKNAATQGRILPDGSVSASPLAETSILVITATSDTEANAITLTQAYATGLTAYIASLNGADASDVVLTQYRDASAALAKAKVALGATAAGTVANINAQAAVDAAQLQVTALGSRYSAQVGTNNGGGQLSPLTDASSQGSDQKSLVSRYGALGFLAGFILASGLAALLEVRGTRHKAARFARRATDVVVTLDEESSATKTSSRA